jgi:hypothetical protein
MTFAPNFKTINMLQFYSPKTARAFLGLGLYAAAFIALSSSATLAQGRLVLNGDVVVNVHGGTSSAPAYLVVDNSNTNAISATGNGHINSEGQFNILQWNVKNGTGTYLAPLGAGSSELIPISLAITTAGTNDGTIRFATYGTGQNNLPLPQGVSSIAHQDIIGDGLSEPDPNGAKIFDRFWFVGPNAYTTAPNGIMSLTYIPTSMSGDLTAGSTSMAAQSHNGTSWSTTQFGVDNLSGAISGIPFSASSFNSTWTLVESGAPLPITLLTFNAVWANERQSVALVNWSTASEQENDFFVIERSADGQNWQTLGQIQGAGNSIHTINYQFKDESPVLGVAYYRLRQVDFDGTASYTHIVSLKREIDGAAIAVYPNPANNQFQIAFEGFKSETANINILDNSGRVVLALNNNVLNNPSQIINTSNFQSGVYYIHVTSETESFIEKIVITD